MHEDLNESELLSVYKKYTDSVAIEVSSGIATHFNLDEEGVEAALKIVFQNSAENQVLFKPDL